MKILKSILLFCIATTAFAEVPTVNIPPPLRQKNWVGNENEGSCVHASFVMLLRWQGHHKMAAHWRKTYQNGEYFPRFCERLDREGITYAATYRESNVAFLEWAVRTRRGCMVDVNRGAHMVILVHMDQNHVWLLDNNYIDRFKKVPRQTFVSEWSRSGSWALTPLYTPPPPLLRR